MRVQREVAVYLVNLWHSRKKMRRTGFAIEKKSISFPIVNGIDMDTLDEINRSPTAVINVFRSGFARDAILRSEVEDVVIVPLFFEGHNMDANDTCLVEGASRACGVEENARKLKPGWR